MQWIITWYRKNVSRDGYTRRVTWKAVPAKHRITTAQIVIHSEDVLQFILYRVVFNWLSWNQNQSTRTDQSHEHGHTIIQSNSKQIYVADAKGRKLWRERLTIGFRFASDRLRKRREFFKPICKTKANENYFSRSIVKTARESSARSLSWS